MLSFAGIAVGLNNCWHSGSKRSLFLFSSWINQSLQMLIQTNHTWLSSSQIKPYPCGLQFSGTTWTTASKKHLLAAQSMTRNNCLGGRTSSHKEAGIARERSGSWRFARQARWFHLTLELEQNPFSHHPSPAPHSFLKRDPHMRRTREDLPVQRGDHQQQLLRQQIWTY